MSGHSKWATTFRQKSATDAKRGARFTQLARAITGAARAGVNPDANFKLRLAIDQARAANMPKDNIERAIQRGTGSGAGEQLEAVAYEGFGPDGVAVIAECLTDNRNRTGSEIRHLFEQHGGSIGTPGSVSWQFERSGMITVSALNEDDELAAIDLGASDIQRDPTGVVIACPPSAVEPLRHFFTARGKTAVTKLVMLPKETKLINDPRTRATLQVFWDALDGHPDVQEFYHNAAGPQTPHHPRH